MKQKVALLTVALTFLGALSFGVFGSERALAYTLEENCSEYENPVERDDCRTFQTKEKEKPKGLADCKDGDETCCGDVKTSIIGGDKICNEGDDDGIILSFMKWILRIMTAGVGVAAVGGIGYGALLYTTAESKPEQTKKAIGIITNVVIGIIAYALMAVLLNFIIPGGVIG